MNARHMVPRSMTRADETRMSQQALGVRLRQEFDSIVRSPVPAEWLDILRKADAA